MTSQQKQSFFGGTLSWPGSFSWCKRKGETGPRTTYKSFIAPAILREIFMMLMCSVACAFPALIYCCYYVSICIWNSGLSGPECDLTHPHLIQHLTATSNQLSPATQSQNGPYHKLRSIIPPPITLPTRQAVTMQAICLKVVIWFIMKGTWG